MTGKIETVLLAAGEPPTHAVPVGVLRAAKRVIACDGAWRTALALGRTPDAVVGDGDSLAADDREELVRRGIPLVAEAEQETNDLCKAFRHALRTGADGDLAILGATGRREDHTIGNIFHLIDFAVSCADAPHDRSVVMVTDAGVFEPVLPPGRSWTDVGAGSPVSVFAPFPGTEMASDGLVWPLKGVTFDALWRGTLNRTLSDSFSITTNRPVLVFRPHPNRILHA